MAARAVLFDYGNVLVRWSRDNLYSKLIPDPAERDRFLNVVCPPDWHDQHDGGALMAETLPERIALFPDQAELIRAYGARYGEMIAGEIEGSIAILDELAAAGVPLAMLTNMPADQQDACFAPFSRRHLFPVIVVSGPLKLKKPDRRIFELTLAQMGCAAADVLFVDDSAKNIEGAAALGFHTHLFTAPEPLREVLAEHGLLR